MAGRDLSKEIFGESQGRDLSGQIFKPEAKAQPEPAGLFSPTALPLGVSIPMTMLTNAALLAGKAKEAIGIGPQPETGIAQPTMAQGIGMTPTQQRIAIATAGAMAAPATAGPIVQGLYAGGAEVLAQKMTGEGNTLDAILAFSFPVALRGLFKLGREATKFVGKRLPGAAFGLTERAKQMADALITRLRPEQLDDLKKLSTALDSMDVPLAKFRSMAVEIEQKAAGMAPKLRPSLATGIVKQVDDLIAATKSGALPLRQIRDNLEEIGAEIGRLRRATVDKTGLVRGATRNLNALQKAYHSILDDFERLPAKEGGILSRYRKALRLNFAVDDLEKVFEKGMEQREIDGAWIVRGRLMRRWWQRGKDSEFVKKAFTRDQIKEIDQFMDDLLLLPALPRPVGVNAGTVRAFTRTAGAGGLATAMFGPEVGVGVLGAAAIAPRVVTHAMMTPTGRNMLIRLLKESPVLTPQAVQLLAAATRQAVSRDEFSQRMQSQAVRHIGGLFQAPQEAVR